jgi:hypothetical protein
LGVADGLRDFGEELLQFGGECGGDRGELTGGDPAEGGGELGERTGQTVDGGEGFFFARAEGLVSESGLGAGDGEVMGTSQ